MLNCIGRLDPSGVKIARGIMKSASSDMNYNNGFEGLAAVSSQGRMSGVLISAPGRQLADHANVHNID